jgi:hypothetical protein
MTVGVDTVRAVLDRVEVRPGGKLKVVRSYEDGESLADGRHLYTRTDGTSVGGGKAYYNDDLVQFDVKHKGPATIAQLKFNPAKVIYGENVSNVSTGEQLRDAVIAVEHHLDREAGILVDLRTARLNRLDVNRNVELSMPLKAYGPAFDILSAGRLKNKKTYEDGWSFQNSEREVVFYDKRLEQEKRKQPVEYLAENLLRGEVRAMTLRAVESRFGEGVRVADLCKRFDAVPESYFFNMAEVFKFNAKDLTKIYQDKIEAILRAFKDRGGRYWMRSALTGLGADVIWGACGGRQGVSQLLYKVGLDKVGVYRQLTKIEEARDVVRSTKRLDAITVGSLYNELKSEFLKVA